VVAGGWVVVGGSVLPDEMGGLDVPLPLDDRGSDPVDGTVIVTLRVTVLMRVTGVGGSTRVRRMV
jgi:hypothetical protein